MTKISPLWFGVVSLFPDMFEALSRYGVSGRAFEKGLWDMQCFNPRDETSDSYHRVDDRIYGGGPGVLLKPEPLALALKKAKRVAAAQGREKTPVIYLSPQGETFNQAMAKELLSFQSIIFLAGRYEGIDERIVTHYVDREVSIGDYVLSGGELPIMVILDTILRLFEGVLGHPASACEDSFSEGGLEGKAEIMLDCPHYTRPSVFEGLEVPEILLSGAHQDIALWRQEQRRKRTQQRRPELLAQKTGDEKK
jgi:tRNA (guanine37-N1)-methyltransferase